MIRSKVVALAAAMLCFAVACSSETDGASDEIATTAAQSTNESPTTEAPPSTSAEDEESSAVVIDVQISDGTVAPTNERIDAVVGEPVVVRISSDAIDELHVHSVPDHTFAVEPTQDQEFEFVVEVPGQVALELHDAGRTIATLVVRP